MRICFVQQDVNLWGAPRSLLTLINFLRARGHSCVVLLHGDCPFGMELQRQGIGCEIVHRRNWTYMQGRPWGRRIASGLYSFGANALYADRAARIARSFKPDLIHTNSSKTQFGAILAWKLDVPHVWHFREFLGGTISSGIVFSLGCKLSCRFIEASSAATVVISRVLGSHLGLRASRVPVHVVYNGVMSLDRMRNAASAPMPDTSVLTLAWLGRFETYKHPLVVLEAIRILRHERVPVRLVMAGTGEARQVESVRRFVGDHHLEEAVELRGFTEDVDGIYRQSHAVIMSSTADAFGRVTAEAMAYGRPVIGADACATSELIEHEKDGLLFRPCDPEDLAAQILRLSRDKDLRERLAANAATKAQEEFTIERYGRRMEAIFKSVVDIA